MEFKRTLTPGEVTLLGDRPEQRLHGIIDEALHRMSNVHDVQSVESRILSMMTKVKPMKSRDIMEAHNAVYGNSPITLAYTRFTINGMYQAGLLERVARGEYVKSATKEEQLETVKNQIMMIEMTGKITGREGSRYKQLCEKRTELMK